MAPKAPTEAEIQAAAEQLGLVDEHGRYDRAKRGHLAKAVMIARAERKSAAKANTKRSRFVAEVAALESELITAGVTPQTTAGVVAAMSAALWRGVREETAQL